jgi:hypothetical protein
MGLCGCVARPPRAVRAALDLVGAVAPHRGLMTTAPASPGPLPAAASSTGRGHGRAISSIAPIGNLLPAMLVPAAAQIIRVWSVAAAQLPVC